MTDRKDRVERTIEMLLYAPLGLGLYLKDVAPTFVDMFVARGRAEVDRRHEAVSRRLTTARSMGQVAAAFGVPMVRQQVARQVGEARGRAQEWLSSTGIPARPSPRARTPERTAPPPPARAVGAGDSRPADRGDGAGSRAAEADDTRSAELPIPGYDALSASQVVERLAGLGHDDLEAVRAYESAHRKRRTILGKIEQLAG